MDILKVIGNRIVQYRKIKKISQEKLAELSELHKNYIGCIERAEKNPSITVLYKISKALGVPIENLVKDL